MQIAVLCAAKKSIYKTIENLEVYDEKRNARSYTGTFPVIAHPPCRGYSAFTRHWAKPRPGEKDLAFFCTERMLLNGGVLEHPAHSRYVRNFKMDKRFRIATIHQSWWGYPTTKKTWLLMPAHYKLPEIPFSLKMQGKEKQIFENMSHFDRHRTTLEFATWLIKLIEVNHET